MKEGGKAVAFPPAGGMPSPSSLLGLSSKLDVPITFQLGMHLCVIQSDSWDGAHEPLLITHAKTLIHDL